MNALEIKEAVIYVRAKHPADGELGKVVHFDPALSFDENLARFRAEAERLDADCARILFDNLDTLLRGEDARDRNAIQEFHRAVLAALDALPEAPAS